MSEVENHPPLTLGSAVHQGMNRIRSVWPGHKWADAEAEYRRVLKAMGDPAVVEWAVNAYIDTAQERFPPPPGVLVKLARERPSAERKPRGEVRFAEAVPDHRDPPGTVRYVVIQPDGRRIPAGARIAGEV